MTGDGLRSTLGHIRMLDSRRSRLHEAQLEAEEQLFHRVGVMHQAGQLALIELAAIYDECLAFKTAGISSRWNAHIDISWGRMRYLAQHLPNGPEGTWIGVAPLLDGDPAPLEGMPVVYVLFGEDNEPCYVGSTAKFRTRLRAHISGGKEFVRWQAYPCETREDAYVLEERLLIERMPRLNRKRGR